MCNAVETGFGVVRAQRASLFSLAEEIERKAISTAGVFWTILIGSRYPLSQPGLFISTQSVIELLVFWYQKTLTTVARRSTNADIASHVVSPHQLFFPPLHNCTYFSNQISFEDGTDGLLL